MEKGPFSLYDFMGYFFPGALTIYLVVLGQHDMMSYFSKDFFQNTKKSFIDIPIYLMLFYVIISYCLGHFLSFFSTLTIEKYTRLVYEDPSKILLSDKDFQPKNYMQSLTLNKWRLVMFILIWPLIVYDWLLVRYLKYNHSYLKRIEAPYKDLVKTRINKVFRDIGHSSDVFKEEANNYHRLLIHYNYEFTKYHGHKLMNYVSLYGFLRVITLVSCLFFNYIFISYLCTHSLQMDWIGFKNLVYFLLCLFSVASMTFIFYLGYLKFYRRYTLENLMLVLIVNSSEK